MVAVVGWTGACSESSTEVSVGGEQGGSAGGIFGTRQTPALTPVQGQALLVDIRRDPTRLKRLTIREREYLAKAGIGANAVKARRAEE